MAKQILAELQDEVDQLKTKGITPCLALIHTTRNKRSSKYVNQKKTIAEKIGINFIPFHLIDTTQKEIVKLIHRLNEDQNVHGIFIQIPLDTGLNETEILSAITPNKDVDGLSPTSIGKIQLGEKTIVPAGIRAIFMFLEYYMINPMGKYWVILGSSNYLCKPLAHVLMNKNISYTYFPVISPDVLSHLKCADVICVEVFKKHVIGSDMVKDGVVIFDFGNNYDSGSVFGDVNVSVKAAAVTPVPGGVGPLVIAMLLKNTVELTRAQTKCWIN